MKQKIPFRLLLLFSILAFSGGIIGGMITSDEGVEMPYADKANIASVIEKVSPAIVKIEGVNPLSDQPFKNTGSGFIASEEGLVVTNKHVVSDPEATYAITLKSGLMLEVENIKLDDANDLAVLELIDVDGHIISDLPTVKLSDSNTKVGQQVVALGHSMASSGIVSSLDSFVVAGSLQKTENLSGMIQTDAVITSGSSGGPLVNLKGEVVGVNTALDTTNGQVSFAIPVDRVKELMGKVE